jgi:cytosine/adenosine deaminase-related metal-dependent hydrolase
MAIGTDIHPHHMLDELRCATVMAKVADGDTHALFVDSTFDAATMGGARALGRDDIGRLATGCRADLVLVDTGHWTMRPLRDPLRSLVFSGLERPVRHVFVDGVQVVADGSCLTIDMERAAAGLEAAQERMLAAVPSRDRAGRSIDAIIPRSLPMMS